MQNDASSTKLSLHVPLEEAVPIAEAANQNGSTLFGFITAQISRELILCAMSIDLSPSARDLRLTLKLPVSEAVKLYDACRQEQLAPSDWIAHLVQAPKGSIYPQREGQDTPARKSKPERPPLPRPAARRVRAL
jgi:hypothetical protein